jgi:hypothetical protein
MFQPNKLTPSVYTSSLTDLEHSVTAILGSLLSSPIAEKTNQMIMMMMMMTTIIIII